MALSSDILATDAEALLLRSVLENALDRFVFLLGRFTFTLLTLARLTLALRTAATNPNDDLDDDGRRRSPKDSAALSESLASDDVHGSC